jgi:fatty aldehyde-generating acyl-ACP reductase
MDRETTRLDFALIGHLETWEKISNVVHALRGDDLERLSMEDIRSIVPWIPPRTVVHVRTVSVPSGKEALGIYIDTFITPDELQAQFFKKNLAKVQAAAQYAVREQPRIAALGGFTSIVVEGDFGQLPKDRLVFTTGNTLTAAYIVKGIERACTLLGITLNDSRLLVIGSTGDVASGCVRYFTGRVKELLLCARNRNRLHTQSLELQRNSALSRSSVELDELLPFADVVIAAASLASPSFSLDNCKPGALVCDAGYPKNIRTGSGSQNVRIFFGGMGRVLGGFYFEPDLIKAFYEYPLPFIGHGCMLEGMLLALANRFESFSKGRGFITPEKIEEVWKLALDHGFSLSPFFNHSGLWNEQP